MTTKTYTLEPGQKATQVMIGTPDTLIWGDLITREQTRISAFLNTLAEDFVVHVVVVDACDGHGKDRVISDS